MVMVVLATCVWLHHRLHLLEQKLITAQRTLSSSDYNATQSKPSINGEISARGGSTSNRDEESGCLNIGADYRTKLSSHTRSLSVPSVADIQRQTETIGRLSRPDFTSLTSAEGGHCVNGHRPGGKRGGATVASASGCGQLSSHSLSSLDDRRFEVSYLVPVY